MNGLGGLVLVALGTILVIGAYKGTLLSAARQLDSGLPGGTVLSGPGSNSGPPAGAPGSGVTTQ